MRGATRDSSSGGEWEERASAEPLSVLHVAAPAEAGGLETVVEGLAVGHTERGHRVRVLAVVEPGDEEHPFVTLLEDREVDVRALVVPRRGYLRERRLVAEECGSFAPDVLHTHGSRPDVLHVGLGKVADVPAVTTVHGSSRLGGITRLYEWIQAWSYRRFDAVVAVSEDLRQGLVADGIDPDRIQLIRNSWGAHRSVLDRAEARDQLGLPHGAKVVGWCGRFIRVKGPDVFVRAVAELPAPEFIVSLIGDGPMLPEIRRWTSDRGMGDRMHFHGMIQDAGRLFRAFDVFVLSSRSEGAPMVLFEAMAAGVPIVATAVGGVPEFLSGGVGWLVPPGDPRALAKALATSLEEPDELRSRGERGRRRLDEEFSGEKWLSEYERLYRELRMGRAE